MYPPSTHLLFGTEPDQYIFVWPGQAVFGAGSAERLSAWMQHSGSRKPLVVSDAGLVAAGLVEPHLARLRDAGLVPCLFDGVEANPTLDNVAQALDLWHSQACDGVVALGGGSVIDVCKVLLARLCSDAPVEQVLREGDALLCRPIPPFAAIPTTAGTGSESTTAALVKDAQGRKHVLRSRACRPQWVALDPLLTLSVPPAVTACTGFDTVMHALGAATNRATNPVGEALALQAMVLSFHALPLVIAQPDALQARSDMLLASYLAGVAMSLRGTDGIHGLCTPLESLVDVPHAHVLAVVCVPLMRFTLPAATPSYARVARACGLLAEPVDDAACAAALVEAIDHLRRAARLPCTLAELGVRADQLDAVIDIALGSPSVALNARKPTRDDLVSLYQAMQPA